VVGEIGDMLMKLLPRTRGLVICAGGGVEGEAGLNGPGMVKLKYAQRNLSIGNISQSILSSEPIRYKEKRSQKNSNIEINCQSTLSRLV
jgi:hypothetical protein